MADDVIRGLNNNVVFVALNFSKRLPSTWRYWDNIHGDSNVRWLLDGKVFDAEKYRGAYITDIIKNVVGSEAQNVADELALANIRKNIGWFFEEIDLLGSDRIEMYLFGDVVANIFKKYLMNRFTPGYPAFRKKVKKCQHIFHYSGRNNGRFINFTPEELGLRAESKPDLDILWDDGDKA